MSEELITIYHIEDRGSMFIYHFVVYMVGGLRFIFDNKLVHNNYGDTKNNYEHNIMNKNITIKYPINIFIQNFVKSEINMEILDFLSDKVKLIDDLTQYINNPNCQIINNHGESLDLNIDLVSKDNYIFLRQLFCVENNEFNNNKYIFIKRSNMHANHNQRMILNETELVSELEKLGFLCIKLEEYNLLDKIKLFNTSSIILSPTSSGLVFTFCSNKKTKIIEICPQTNRKCLNTYKQMCETFGLYWNRINAKKIDENDNMIVDVDHVINCVNNIKNNTT